MNDNGRKTGYPDWKAYGEMEVSEARENPRTLF